MEFQPVPIRLYSKILSSLLLGTVGISGVGYSGSVLYEQMSRPDFFSDGAYIGPIVVKGQSRASAKQSLDQVTLVWKKQGSLKLKKEDKEVAIDLNIFSFDTVGSAEKASLSGNSKLLVTINDEALKDLVQKNFDIKEGQLDWSKLKVYLLDKASILPSKAQVAKLDSFYISSVAGPKDVVASAETTMPYEVLSFKSLAEQLDGLQIQPKTNFSLLQALQEKKMDLSSAEALNALASTLYAAALKTNFEIVERHIGRILPLYSELGYEAYIVPGKMDLVIKNTNETPYTLHVEYQPKQLKISVLGAPFPHSYQIDIQEKRQYSPKTIVHYVNDLNGDQKRVVVEGSYGYSAKVFRQVVNGENVVYKQLISDDFYFPVYKIIEQAAGTDPALNQMMQSNGNQNPAKGMPNIQNSVPEKQINPSSKESPEPSAPSTSGSGEQPADRAPEHVIGRKI